MKTYITALLISAIMAFAGCHSGHKHSNQNHDGHDHSEHDGHDHSDHDDHDHDDHDHDSHGDHDDHDSHGEEEHSDEIIFSKEQAKLVGLTTETVTLGAFQQVIKTSGQIEATQGNEAFIVATANGIVSFKEASIIEGMPINKGQSIASISAKKLPEGDPTEKARIAYETVKKELARADKLIKDQIISVKEYDDIKLRYETLKMSYEAQASNITNNGVTVNAPISGYIKNRMVEQGEYVSVGQPIASVLQNNRLQLRAEVSESHYKWLKNVNDAHFRPGYEDVVYRLSDLNGQLLSFGKTSAQSSFYIPITFEFDNTEDIIPGSFAEIFLLTNLQNKAISIPVSSITEEQGLYFVYIQLDEEGYQKQEVTLGQSNGKRVQVLSGLKINDKVVTKGVYQVKLAATSSVIPEGHSH